MGGAERRGTWGHPDSGWEAGGKVVADCVMAPGKWAAQADRSVWLTDQPYRKFGFSRKNGPHVGNCYFRNRRNESGCNENIGSVLLPV